jgi:spermidine synthase
LKKWTLAGRTLTPDGKIVSLHEHDGSYTIRVDGAELMSTRRHSSEEQIAKLACAHLKEAPGARVLVGGLGFGFTLRAALAALGSDAKVVVAEILAAVVAWNRNPEFGLAMDALADPRVTVVERDVADLIREGRASFDSIILDVDNGPNALSAAGNGRLYEAAGLRLAHAALRPMGCVAFWSAARDSAFEKLMAQAGFAVTVHRRPAHKNSGPWHTLYLGRGK